MSERPEQVYIYAMKYGSVADSTRYWTEDPREDDKWNRYGPYVLDNRIRELETENAKLEEALTGALKENNELLLYIAQRQDD